MNKLFFLLVVLPVCLLVNGQPADCTLKPPTRVITFATGDPGDFNTTSSYNYLRVARSCPTDGYYSYTSFTSDCFRGDWHTLDRDHTEGDEDGNMMLVNASPSPSTFLTTAVGDLKGGTLYEFAVYMMNVCKITEKCPFPLLPDIAILLVTPDGNVLKHLPLGELPRRSTPQWTRYSVFFTTPATKVPLTLVMMNRAPGGCGNDFALDDISFSECVKNPIVVTRSKKPLVIKKIVPKPVAKTKIPPVVKEPQKPVLAAVAPKKPVPGKRSTPVVASRSRVNDATPPPAPEVSIERIPVAKPEIKPIENPKPPTLPRPPSVITGRTNQLVKLIRADAGEIRLDLYDNGEVDGDTVSVYHNNVLVVSHARLSEKAVTFRFSVDASNPHHELVMVAHNLGSIPPNTSMMVVTAGSQRHEVFISSTETKNAKVVFDLKE